MAQEKQLVLKAMVPCKPGKVGVVGLLKAGFLSAQLQKALSGNGQGGIRIGFQYLAEGFQQIVVALQGDLQTGGKDPVADTGFILPPPFIEGLPQGFPAQVVFCLGGQELHTGLVPVGAAQNMAGQGKGPGFQLSPEGIFALLIQDVVPADQIPEAVAPLDAVGHTLGVVPGIDAAQALDADAGFLQKPRVPAGVHHGQGMAVFGAPDVDGIGLKVPQLPGKQGFQSAVVGIGHRLLKYNVGKPFVNGAGGCFSAPAEDADFQAGIPAQVGKNVVHPQSAAARIPHSLTDGAGDYITQPKQAHGFSSFSFFPACPESFRPGPDCFGFSG